MTAWTNITDDAGNSWWRVIKSAPDCRLRLFCFPYAGGNAAIFHEWAGLLPSAVKLCVITLPGRGLRLSEPSLTCIETIAEGFSQAAKPFLNRPITFFGHSVGGLLAFESAHILRRETGLEPSHLFVSATNAPQLPYPGRPPYDGSDAVCYPPS
jgi:medium-chain acyl-[acyl-carrier-protein] hydrolase